MTKTKEFEMYSGRANYPKIVKARIEKHSNIDNRKNLLKFWNSMITKGSGEYRPAKVTAQLLRLIETNNIFLTESLIDEWEQVIVEINTNSKWSNATRCDYRRTIRQFYNWYKRNDERMWDQEKSRETHKFYDWLEDAVKTTYKQKVIDPKNILTEEDLQLLLKRKATSTTTRDDAILTLLFETGIRAGELLNMKIKDFRVDNNLGIGYVDVDGKTGKRSPEIVKSIKSMIRWLDVHPDKDNLEAYLWVKYHGQSITEGRMSNRVLNRLIKIIFEKVNLKKPNHPHWFRHSCATRLAPVLTFPVFCRYFGWSLTSRQAKTYVHLCQKQQTDAFLRMHSLQKTEDLEVEFISCSCGANNEVKNMLCFRCGKPLRVEDAITIQGNKDTQISDTWKIFMHMTKNPKMLQQYRDMCNEKGIYSNN